MLLAALLVGGCSQDDGSCPRTPVAPLPSGTFVNEYMPPGAGTATLPSYASDAPKKLEVDREKGTVRVSWVVDGHRVVETWRIRDVHPRF